MPQILLKSNTTGYAEELKVRYVPPSYEPKSTTKQLDLVAISCENMATITTQQALNCCTMVDDLNFSLFSFEKLLLFFNCGLQNVCNRYFVCYFGRMQLNV